MGSQVYVMVTSAGSCRTGKIGCGNSGSLCWQIVEDGW